MTSIRTALTNINTTRLDPAATAAIAHDDDQHRIFAAMIILTILGIKFQRC